MKYEQTKGSGLDRETLRSLETLAKDSSYTIQQRGGLDTRMNDSEDYLEIGIAEITRMLERAYKLGYTGCFDDYNLHKLTVEQIQALKRN